MVLTESQKWFLRPQARLENLVFHEYSEEVSFPPVMEISPRLKTSMILPNKAWKQDLKGLNSPSNSTASQIQNIQNYPAPSKVWIPQCLAFSQQLSSLPKKWESDSHSTSIQKGDR